MAATNWAGNVVFSARVIHAPTSVDALQRIVASEPRIRALGSGHSFSQLIDGPAALVRLDQLPRTMAIDAAHRTVTVSAAHRYADIVGALDDAGFALPNMASLPHITVAGSCATASHGSGDSQRVLSASVASMRFVGPEGDLFTLARDAPDFAGAAVHLGALGVVVEVSLDVVPRFEMAQWVEVRVPLDAVAASLDAVFAAAYSVSVFTDWQSGDAMVWAKCRADEPRPASFGGQRADQNVHPSPGLPAEHCTQQLGVVGPWHERLPHFRAGFVPSAGDELQSEYFVARRHGPAVFAALRELGEAIGAVVLVSEVRSVKADDLWLSPAYGEDVLAFHFTWRPDAARVQPLLAAIEDRLIPFGVRAHWAKLTAQPPRQLAKGPRSGDFARLARSLDPAGKFRNAFVAALFD